MEPLDIETPPKKLRVQDRVTLGPNETKKIDAWLSQVNDSSKGFLALTRSDLVNFLVRIHADTLSGRELSQIRSDHYDPVRHITWIAPQIKQAIQDGDSARVSELQEELRKVELSANGGSTAKRKARIADVSPRRSRKPKSESMPNEMENSVRNDAFPEEKKSI